MARYRSGHNGAVLKTVGGDKPSVGSNPTRAAMPFHLHIIDENKNQLVLAGCRRVEKP